MAASTVTKNLRDGLLRLRDGTGTPVELDVAIDEGNLRFTITQNVNPILDRGVLAHPRLGDQEPVSWSFGMKYTEMLDDSAAGTPYEFLTQTGAYTGNVSTRTDTDVFCNDLRFYVDDPEGGTDELIEFPDCWHDSIEFQEGDEYNTLTVSGRAFVTAPTVSKANP